MGTGSGKCTAIAVKGPGPACGPLCERSGACISITWPSMWRPTRRCSTPSGSHRRWCNACVVPLRPRTVVAHEPEAELEKAISELKISQGEKDNLKKQIEAL